MCQWLISGEFCAQGLYKTLLAAAKSEDLQKVQDLVLGIDKNKVKELHNVSLSWYICHLREPDQQGTRVGLALQLVQPLQKLLHSGHGQIAALIEAQDAELFNISVSSVSGE